jgi:hypothetical protein
MKLPTYITLGRYYKMAIVHLPLYVCKAMTNLAKKTVPIKPSNISGAMKIFVIAVIELIQICKSFIPVHRSQRVHIITFLSCKLDALFLCVSFYNAGSLSKAIWAVNLSEQTTVLLVFFQKYFLLLCKNTPAYYIQRQWWRIYICSCKLSQRRIAF